MKEMKNIKKWFIALAALALLLIPSVALADTLFCEICGGWRDVDFFKNEYYNEQNHTIFIRCAACKTPTGEYWMKHTESRAATCFSPAYCDVCQSHYGESRSHTESRAATCFSPAYCDACQSYYGEPRSHDWGEWMYYDSKSDQRFCQYADCDKKEFASHHWGAWLKADETSHYHECQASD